MKKRRNVISLLVLLSAIPFLLASSERPNFTGVWKFNPAKSSLQMEAPHSSIFRITHQEPNFTLSRTHVYVNPDESDTWSIELTTDGKEVVQKEKEMTLRGRLYWDQNELVFDSKFFLKDGTECTNIVRYSLSEDGKVFTAREQFRSPKIKHDNVWIFDKQQ